MCLISAAMMSWVPQWVEFNNELSSSMSWVGCLLTDSVLPDAWKLSKWEKHKFWEGFDYKYTIKSSNSTHHQTQLIIAAEIRHIIFYS